MVNGTARMRGAALAVVLSCLAAALATPALAQQVLLIVNGEPITAYDVDQRAKLDMLASHKATPKQEIIEGLIDDKLKAQYAKRFKIEFSEKEIDQQYAEMARRMHLNPDLLTKALAQGGVDAPTFKAKILSDMSWQIIIRGRFKERFQIGESEIDSTDVGYDYTLRPILFVVPTGNTPLMEARRKDAEALRARFANCETGIPAAQAQHGVVIRPPITKNSADLDPPALRELLNKIEVGHLTAPEVTSDGIEMWAVCDKKETRLETPEKRRKKQEIFAKRFEVESKTQLRELRRQAMIERQ
jgi:peptidyl-prolyl cis-trans isomerase SurA